MKRRIIRIDEEKCDGCGLCVNACHEGAIGLRDGKAHLMREDYCDGLGDCIGECPQGAISFVEIETAGAPHAGNAPAASKVPADCGCSADDEPMAGGCPGSRVRILSGGAPRTATPSARMEGPGKVIPSDLEQWPVQLHLVPTRAPFYQNRELVVLSTCAPVASADVHWRFLRGRAVVVACPKLDRTDPYVEKLAAILRENTVTRVLVVRMTVPCCGGLSHIVRTAAALAGTGVPVEEIRVDLDGTVLGA